VAVQFRPASQAKIEIENYFPNLITANWEVKSPFDDSYQCIAWAACRTDCQIWPYYGYTWFQGVPIATDLLQAPVDCFVQGFRTLGYKPCDSKAFEFGYQKLAIYANNGGVTHMARQHFWGRGWLSKLGNLEDIVHDNLEDVEGDMSPSAAEYGKVVKILKRTWWSALVNRCLLRGI
jgi:hypothetical protein